MTPIDKIPLSKDQFYRFKCAKMFDISWRFVTEHLVVLSKEFQGLITLMDKHQDQRLYV